MMTEDGGSKIMYYSSQFFHHENKKGPSWFNGKTTMRKFTQNYSLCNYSYSAFNKKK